MIKFPMLISIPHGGMRIPADLENSVCLSELEIFDDIDLYTNDIYNVGDLAEVVLYSDIARTIVDLNRAPDDLPPDNPDGVVKSLTCKANPIYFIGKEPDKTMIDNLINRYYKPYHESINLALENDKIKIGLDCHSMVPIGPEISPDRGEKRPLFCLGNRNGRSCTYELVKYLSECIIKAFDVDSKNIALNVPFSGGFITRKYGNNPIPWIQIEMNKSFYLNENWMHEQEKGRDRHRLKKINFCFQDALKMFTKRL